MSLSLYVDGDRWRSHLRSVLAPHPTLVPVIKGNGYGFGNAPVGGMRSMGFWNLDVALVKSFFLTETKQIQFRAEGYNVLNHMVLDVPGGSIAPSYSGGQVSYGTAGVVTNIANLPRSLQLALKFNF